MQDHQTKAVRVQSSAVIVAALITTTGAITASCIQTGIISKTPTPSAMVVASRDPEVNPPMPTFAPTPAPTRQASFLGTIEPVSEKIYTPSQPTSMYRDTRLMPATATTPALLPAESGRQMASPWTALKTQPAANTEAQLPKTAQEASAWDSVTRFFGQR